MVCDFLFRSTLFSPHYHVVAIKFSGGLLLSLLAFLLPHWQHLYYAMAAINASTSLFYFILPESPRWLLSNGKIGEATKIIVAIAAGKKYE